MPKIHCSIRGLIGKKPFPFVSFFLRAPYISKPIDALIDTGSPFTVLSTNDVLSTRMPITKMQSGETVSLAGFRFFNHPIRNVTLNFRTESDQIFKVNLRKIGALIPTKISRKDMDKIKHIPSIIGNDFLENQKIALYFHPSARIVYLEF